MIIIIIISVFKLLQSKARFLRRFEAGIRIFLMKRLQLIYKVDIYIHTTYIDSHFLV
jgi:hypothetical protein